jgi:hypothetical protein
MKNPDGHAAAFSLKVNRIDHTRLLLPFDDDADGTDNYGHDR